MPRHKGQVRFGWRKLSQPYRTRLERQGITQRAWEDGADLRKARGKKPKPPPGAIPVELAEELATAPSEAALAAAARFTRPPWIPEWVTNDVAAILSQLPDPSKWVDVIFSPQPDGAPWQMTVELKRGYPITIDIPGGGGPGSGAKEILDLVADINSGAAGGGGGRAAEVYYDDYYRAKKVAEIFYEVSESDMVAKK